MDYGERSAYIEKAANRESRRQPSADGGDSLARALGWFSIGLGLAEVAVPRSLARLIGAPEHHTTLLRIMGAREIAAGIGLLTKPRPAEWMWARVGGDLLDMALLGIAMTSDYARYGRLSTATAAVAGVTALDMMVAQQLTRTDEQHAERALEVRRAIAVNRSPEECYRFWRDFQNLPRFMKHLKSVETRGPNQSHWVAKGPAGMEVRWDAEITDERENQMISWRSVGSAVYNTGTVRFQPAPGGRGTVIRVDIRYSPPGGKVAANIAKIFGEEPGQQTYDDLRRFKQMMETGEIPTTRGQPSGRATESLAGRVRESIKGEDR
jgi:uncharacterized membrane protein